MSNEYFDIALEKIIKQEVNAVLKQIRAEIDRLNNCNSKYLENGIYFIDKQKVLQIIDKHTNGDTDADNK